MLPVVPTVALVRRELLTNLRSVRAFVYVALAVGFVTLVVVAMWPRDVSYVRAAPTTTELLGMFTMSLLGACALFIPGLTGASIAVEKDRETFDLLAMTLIPRSGIVFAKLVNAVGFYLLLVIAVLPVLGAVFFLVGVDWVQVTASFSIIIVTALSCAMAGLFCSTLVRRTTLGITLSFLAMFVLMGGVALLPAFWAMVLQSRTLERFTEAAFIYVSPFGALIRVLEGRTVLRELVGVLLVQAGWFLGFFVGAVCVLRRPQAPPRIEQRKPIDDAAVLNARRKKFPFYLIDPLRRKKSIEDGRNPMLVRELRWGVLNRGTVLVRIFYLTFGVFFLLGSAVFIGAISPYAAYSEVACALLTFQAGLVAVLAPGFMANSMTKEYELGNIDLLRTTLLRPRDVVLGKLAAGGVSLAPLVLGLLIADIVPGLVIAFTSWKAFPAFFAGLATIAVTAFVSLALGFLASVLTRRTATALLLSYLLNAFFLGGITVGLLVALVLLDEFNLVTFDFEPWAHAAGFFSPIIVYVMDTMLSSRDKVLPGYVLWTASAVAYTIFALGAIRFSVAAFTALRMRDR